MRYTVEYTPRAVEDLKKLTPQAANLVYSWTEKNLVDCQDPRAQGSGRKRGGRWRYRIGAYRLVCEIEEARIVVLAVTSGVEDPSGTYDRRGRAKRRAPSVFLKSTARQPVKAAALLIVTALLTFAFVSRGAEWLLLTQEAERLEGFYRATGGVQELKGPRGSLGERPRGKDASDVIAYLEESPYVERVDVRRSLSAVTPEEPGYSTTYQNANYYSEDVLFYGTLQGAVKLESADGHLEGDYRFTFLVDEVVVGLERMIQEGELVDLVNPRDYTYWTGGFWRDGAEVFQEAYIDMADVAAELEAGGRYLLRGSLDEEKPGVVRGGTATDPDGSQRKVTPSLWFKPLVEDGPWYLSVPEGEADFSDPRVAGLLEEMKIYDDNQHAQRVWACGDLSAMVTTADWTDAQVSLTKGRWLTAEDTELKRPVCVVCDFGNPDAIQLGETITMKLRDITPPAVYSGPKVGDDLYWLAYQYGYLCQEEDFTRLDEIEATSVTIDFEVVGTYSYAGNWTTECIGKTFIPASLVPENFTHTLEVPEPREVAFTLTGPEVQEAFLAESAEDLFAMGYRAVMPESGWSNFVEATGPILRSSLYNALVFAAVLTAGLAIVTVVYFYMRRKELPIARAMGLPAKTCVRQSLTPILLLVGAPGIALGALFGWWWTAQNAGDTLSALAEFGTIDPAALPGECLAAMAGIAFALLAGMTLLGAVVMVRRPVLELLQGAARAAVKEVAAGTAEPSPFVPSEARAAAVTTLRAGQVRKDKPGLRAGLTFRFVRRQAARARLKTALTILLAAGFTVGLAAIQLAIVGSQERINWLYEHTPVEAELMPVGGSWVASIRRDTVQALMDSGYITDYHFEASVTVGSGYAPYDASQETGPAHLGRGESRGQGLLGFESERAFLSSVGSGAGVTITYHEGWNGSLFAREWTGDYDPADSDTLFPVVVPKAVYDELELEPGAKLQVFARSRRPFEVAGYYEGFTGGSCPDPLLLPLSACRTLCSGRITYSKAHVTLDPSLNRQLDQFEAVVTEIAGRQDTATLRVVIWDEELRQAVAPLEGSIQLMRALYPVTLVLSLLCAAGGAALFIMTSAKEAAILRVQGTTKLRTQVILGLQQALACSVGLAAGLTGVLLYVGSARPTMLGGVAASSGLCALGYLAAAVIGSVSSASVVTGRHPLEMLQVKE